MNMTTRLSPINSLKQSFSFQFLQPYLHTAAIIVCASFLLAIAAQVKIPIPGIPVALTGQTFAVLLMGCFLGSKKSIFAVMMYLLEGCLGLPVWAGGASGVALLLSPVGGYYFGYILQAYLAGKITQYGNSKSFFYYAFLLFAVCLLHLTLGSIWLSSFFGWQNMLACGFIPFIPGEMIKCILVTYSFKKS